MKITLNEEWKPLFIPSGKNSYINDHTIFKDSEDRISIIGTYSSGKYNIFSETKFIYGNTSSVFSPINKESLILTKPKYTVKIAPFVFFEEENTRYHMFFGPKNIKHYISKDGFNWIKTTDAINSHWLGLRDPHVIRYLDRFLLYATDFNNTIGVWESSDLFQWRKKTTAFKLGNKTPKSPNSSCESPFVLQINDNFLLFTTIVPWSVNRKRHRELYLNTKVFISKDPTNFGMYALDDTNTADLVCTLEVHAPEIFKQNNTYYISTCGWKNNLKPKGINTEGVYIRSFSFK